MVNLLGVYVRSDNSKRSALPERPLKSSNLQFYQLFDISRTMLKSYSEVRKMSNGRRVSRPTERREVASRRVRRAGGRVLKPRAASPRPLGDTPT
ncbi:unnamed protein product, partial [Brenthis ino]